MAVDFQNNIKDLANDNTYVTELSDVIKSDIAVDDENAMFTTVNDIVTGAPIAGARPLDKVLKADPGCDDTTYSNKIPEAFQQTWNPKDLSVNIRVCWKDFEDSFINFGLGKGIQKADLTSADIGDFLEEYWLDAIKRDIQRVALMGNSSAATVAGGGYLNNSGVTVADYTMIERGLIPSLVYLETLSQFEDNFISIPQNKITAKQYQFDGQDSTSKVSDLAFDLGDKAVNFDPNHMIMNYKMYQGFQKELRDAGAFPTDATRDMLMNGIQKVSVNGFNPVTTKIYDQYTASDTEGIFAGAVSGTDYYHPNFMVLTTKANLQLGFDAAGSIYDADFFVDRKTDYVHFKCKTRMDFKVADPYQLLAAIDAA